MKILLKSILLLALLILAFSCEKSDEPTKPPVNVLPDTTSHDFTWQIDVLGDGNSSVLNDVAIINDTLAYAVGEISVIDSLGNWKNPPYNIARWDGQKWIFESLKFVFDYGQTYSTARAVFAFNSNDVVVSSGSSIMHWDGARWSNIGILYSGGIIIGNVLHFWGTSNENLWGGGLGGSLVYYNGNSWQKLESGTNQDIQDLWGIVDKNTQDKKILCTVSNKYHGGEKRILQILPNNQVADFDWTPQRVAHSVWFLEDTPTYACGSAFFRYENKQWTQVTALPNIFQNRVRGNNANDVFVAGDFGVFAHYNGKSWKVYDFLNLPQGNYEGLAVRDNLVVAVGWNGDRAVVVRGKRKE